VSDEAANWPTGTVLWPLRKGETLSNHDWFPMFHHRLLHSSFFTRVVMENARADLGTALILWCAAISEDPAGTLPDDDYNLAMLARFSSVDEWRRAKDGALQGWRPVMVDDPDGFSVTRLGHPFMLKVVNDMNDRAKARKAANTGAKDRQKAKRVRAKLRGLGLPDHVVNSQQIVDQMVRHSNLSGEWVSDENVRAWLADVIGYTGDIVPIDGHPNPNKARR